MPEKKQYRVRRGYAVHLGGKVYTAGKIVSMTDKEHEAQKWKVEPLHEEKQKRRSVRKAKNTAMAEEEVQNK